MFSKLIILFLFVGFGSPAQTTNTACKKTLQKQPYFIRHNNFVPDDSLAKDLNVFKECGGLDSVDMEIISGEFIRAIASSTAWQKKKNSYQTILKTFKSYTKTEEYLAERTLVINRNQLKITMPSPANWEMAKKQFTELGLTEQQLQELHHFISKKDTVAGTYWNAYLNCFVN